jgi:hypothetical protein
MLPILRLLPPFPNAVPFSLSCPSRRIELKCQRRAFNKTLLDLRIKVPAVRGSATAVIII